MFSGLIPIPASIVCIILVVKKSMAGARQGTKKSMIEGEKVESLCNLQL
jgi:hypothetical protein